MTPARRRRALAGLAMAALITGCGIGATPTPKPACPTAAPTASEAATILEGAEGAVLTTNRGEITIELDTEGAPIAVANFVALARCGFYDGLTFHRVVPDFVAQAGDPQTRDNRDDFAGLGSGSPGYRFEVEFPPEDTTYERYMVAMANAIQYDQATGEITGPTDSNGSQFFVMLDDVPALRPYYTVLGWVTGGTDAVDAIGQVPTNEKDVPLDPVIIETVDVVGEATPSPG